MHGLHTNTLVISRKSFWVIIWLQAELAPPFLFKEHHFFNKIDQQTVVIQT